MAQTVLSEGKIDFLDMSLWDVAKEPNEPDYQGRTLMSYFTSLKRGQVKLGVAGKITTGAQARGVLEAGADFPIIGRAGILHHDFPRRVREDENFEQVALPVSRAYLEGQGLSPAFQTYMNNWPGFVAEDAATSEP